MLFFLIQLDKKNSFCKLNQKKNVNNSNTNNLKISKSEYFCSLDFITVFTF